MSKFKAAILLFLLFYGSLFSIEKNNPGFICLEEFVQGFQTEMLDTFGLMYSSAYSNWSDKLEKIHLYFFANQRTTLEEAREFEIKVTQRLIECINADEKLKPYLDHYPFNDGWAWITISFIKLDGNVYDDGSIIRVYNTKSKIYYKFFDKNAPHKTRTQIELYNEALNIVLNNKRKSNLPFTNKKRFANFNKTAADAAFDVARDSIGLLKTDLNN